MPQFTQWTVPDPFPNVLFNPMAVDKAIADNQSTLGNLDINRQRLGIEQAKLAATQAGNAVWTNPDTPGTTGTPGASVGPLPDAAPDQTRDAAGQASYNFWVGKGLAPHQAAGMAAQEVAESGGRPGVTGDDGQAIGLYQHHADRRALIQANTGIDMTKPDANAQREGAYWELMNSEHGARKLLFAATDPDQAGRAATEFERPDSKRRAIIEAERGRDARRIFQLANPNGAASVATATVDPRAGPRAGLAPPPPAVATAPTTAPADLTTGNPGRKVQIPPTTTTTTGQADDPNMAAVKQAATALLAMPEAEAAVAYGPTVRSLQAQGFAMNAPPTYPGHAALQSLVGGGDAVAQTKTAMRLGGTDVADASGVVVPSAAPPAPQPNVILDASGKPLQAPPPAPNRMMAGVGLPGVTIGLPGNGLAPPATVAAPVTTAAAPTAPPAPAQGKPPVPIPPPAPSRAIDLAPTIQGGQYDGLTPSQAKLAYSMGLGLVPTQEIAARVEGWRQQNLANKQAATSNLAAQQQAEFDRQKYYTEQLEKTGWEPQPDGSLKNKYTGDVKYPPTGRIGTAADGRQFAALPGGEMRYLTDNPSGVTGTGPEASALRTLNDLAAKQKAGIPLTPQEEVNYSSAADVYRGAETITNPSTGGLGRVYKRDLPAGFPLPAGEDAAPSGPKPVTPPASGYAKEQEAEAGRLSKLRESVIERATESAGANTMIVNTEKALAEAQKGNIGPNALAPEKLELVARAKALGINLKGLGIDETKLGAAQVGREQLQQLNGAILRKMYPQRITNADLAISGSALPNYGLDETALGANFDVYKNQNNYDTAKAQDMLAYEKEHGTLKGWEHEWFSKNNFASGPLDTLFSDAKSGALTGGAGSSGGGSTTQTNQGAAPPASTLKDGVVTHYSNGQSWTSRNGQAVRVK